MPGCSQMSGHESHNAQATTATGKLPQPVSAVFDGYIQIQTALAADSLEGITTSAQAIAKSVKKKTRRIPFRRRLDSRRKPWPKPKTWLPHARRSSR